MAPIRPYKRPNVAKQRVERRMCRYENNQFSPSNHLPRLGQKVHSFDSLLFWRYVAYGASAALHFFNPSPMTDGIGTFV